MFLCHLQISLESTPETFFFQFENQFEKKL